MRRSRPSTAPRRPPARGPERLRRGQRHIAGVQTAFDWPGWPIAFQLWDCQANQVIGTQPTAPGPTTGSISTAFDCITGGDSAVIGRIHFAVVTAAGCMTQIESSFPFGTHVINCQGVDDAIDPLGRGSICAPDGGYNACDPIVPVENTTWGTIKSQFNR